MQDFQSISRRSSEQDLTSLGATPYVYHCHHFNLFHDQTVEDALGDERAFELRARAAQDAARPLLSELAERLGATTPPERLELASGLLRYIGHGRLRFSVAEDGGKARGEYLHYSYTWREKYGSRVSRKTPLDAFAAGFAAAATEVAYDLPAATLVGREEGCFGRRDPACEFSLTSEAGRTAASPVTDEHFEARSGVASAGQEESRIATIAGGLKDFVAGVQADARGLVHGFGVYVTRHLSAYYDQTAYDSILAVEQKSPALAPVTEELFGESGHVCVFYTFGNILLSPEWEGLVGPIQGDVEEIVTGCVAIARGLGFGHWTLAELVPNERLVLRASSNYEAPFYLERYGRSDRPRSYFFANAARAMMQLAHRVDWKARPMLTEELYSNLFRSGLAWDIEQTRCLTRGDDHCEVVVTRRRS